ncbi:hypothetical protein [Streptomyces sp. WAC08241]|uniref:hypothetical protein n=1 Tax=Streptomyces sp. WAC08241 TaxID=2487421 RepID=UPI000F76E8CF|nr:hypothetical protein [Streptomyces sp. WAC08241]RSS34582.1 hypothetical protein EF906_29305 [Streptomyces sp. WAC08241]
MDIDLVTPVVRGAAFRIFVPDLRRAGRHLLAAVRAGAHHLHQQSAAAAPSASPVSGTLAHEDDVR